ncbi:hypothetical protein M427DRAFT_448680 [Gonapodya prolifera JEL478]|uniref:AA9 family lytic polysaccharide monooxygenase n=1 Tax=Gonapodya prolifera (strain JEL478) TaxID=1344416 RepID=A0A139ARJ1_GONPJ|nr:hypothetical protein M427DRAFT_448680 [Gonapodya prolifera JEL478]|eukprot:KXS19366.1 hypothetical protein M427DRAFT_448680 [Gonapodya prolifera JEL478]
MHWMPIGHSESVLGWGREYWEPWMSHMVSWQPLNRHQSTRRARFTAWSMALAIVGLVLVVQGAVAGPVLFAANTPTKQGAMCVRQTFPTAGNTVNSAIRDLTSQDLVCGWGATTAAKEVCSVNAGDTIGLVFGNQMPGDNIIATADVGPCEIYMQQTQSAQVAPSSAGWFKVFENTFTTANGWCTVSLIGTGGVLSVTLPPNLPIGSYKLRAEISSVRTADVLFTQNAQRGIQFFVFCLDVMVTNGPASGTFQPMVNIPGYLTGTSPGVIYDPRMGHGANNVNVGMDFPNPFGPAVATIAATGAPVAAAPAPAVPVPPPLPAPSPSPKVTPGAMDMPTMSTSALTMPTGGMTPIGGNVPPAIAPPPVRIPTQPDGPTTAPLNPLDQAPNVLPLPVGIGLPPPAVAPAPSLAVPAPQPAPSPAPSSMLMPSPTPAPTSAATFPTPSPAAVVPAPAMGAPPVMASTPTSPVAPPTVQSPTPWNLWNDTVWSGLGVCSHQNITLENNCITGTCNIPFFRDELVAALSTQDMPNNDFCGHRVVMMNYNSGKVVSAKVVDSCTECRQGSLKLSAPVCDLLGALSDTRIAWKIGNQWNVIP